MSPKEYTNKNKNNYVLTQESSFTYNRSNGHDKNVKKKEKNGVNKHLREGIYRNRIFEMYDNLRDIKSIEDLVKEGAHRACKDIVVNKVVDIEKTKIEIDVLAIAERVKQDFPYSSLPKDNGKARNFYTVVICDMVADIVAQTINTTKSQQTKPN